MTPLKENDVRIGVLIVHEGRILHARNRLLTEKRIRLKYLWRYTNLLEMKTTCICRGLCVPFNIVEYKTK